MIDLYWTVIPVMLVHYYASHPLAKADALRSTVVTVLTWVWSLRLTHNYFRREGWKWGAREDWRFHDMRREYGKNWWWISFFAVYVSQQVGFICLRFSPYIHCVQQLMYNHRLVCLSMIRSSTCLLVLHAHNMF